MKVNIKTKVPYHPEGVIVETAHIIAVSNIDKNDTRPDMETFKIYFENAVWTVPASEWNIVMNQWNNDIITD